jgi:phosphoglycolate phosphatase-like HAD superfamily hydrolase
VLVPLGLPLVDACERAGVTVEAYLSHYDPGAAQPFPGVDDLIAQLDRWGLASNKERSSGREELERLGWSPEAAFFSDDFGGREKQLDPLLAALGLDAGGIVFVGDTRHDRACAAAVGARFALAGWNSRARAGAEPGDTVLHDPGEVLDLLG